MEFGKPDPNDTIPGNFNNGINARVGDSSRRLDNSDKYGVTSTDGLLVVFVENDNLLCLIAFLVWTFLFTFDLLVVLLCFVLIVLLADLSIVGVAGG